jgi:ABC-type xylose transport system substrate-binding protein
MVFLKNSIKRKIKTILHNFFQKFEEDRLPANPLQSIHHPDTKTKNSLKARMVVLHEYNAKTLNKVIASRIQPDIKGITYHYQRDLFQGCKAYLVFENQSVQFIMLVY